ncbi:MAG: hypothetical protein ACNA70_06885 [Brevefilum sp.]
MPDRVHGNNGSFWGSKLMWLLIGMIVIIIILAILALRSPISQPIGERTMIPTLEETPSALSPDETPGPVVIILEQADFLNPEDIGHTDGIIFWSTILLLIVVVGTLREAILRKKSHPNND